MPEHFQKDDAAQVSQPLVHAATRPAPRDSCASAVKSCWQRPSLPCRLLPAMLLMPARCDGVPRSPRCAPPVQLAYQLLQEQVAPVLHGVQSMLALTRASTRGPGFGITDYCSLEYLALHCFQSVSPGDDQPQAPTLNALRHFTLPQQQLAPCARRTRLFGTPTSTLLLVVWDVSIYYLRLHLPQITTLHLHCLKSLAAPALAHLLPAPARSRLQEELLRSVLKLKEEERTRAMLPVHIAIRQLMGAMQDTLAAESASGKARASDRREELSVPNAASLAAAVLQAVFDAELKHGRVPEDQQANALKEVSVRAVSLFRYAVAPLAPASA